MKFRVNYFIILILGHFATPLYGQETIDSIKFPTLSGKYNLRIKEIDLNLNHHFETPEFVPEMEKRWEKYIFSDKRWHEFNFEEQLKPMPDDRKYMLYSSPNNAFHYFNASDPILLRADFHLKPIMGWEKFDLYFFYNGMLVYRYSGSDTWQLGIPSKNFISEVGGGAEYEFSKNWFIFYEFSAYFRNQSFLGTVQRGGVRFRF